MGLYDLLARLERGAGTAGTADVPADVPAHPAQILGGTAGTSGTADTDKGQDVTARGWLLHYADRDPLEVWTAQPATHAGVLADYPDALAAEPLPEHGGRTATEAEAAELRALIQAIYADDTEDDRAEAMRAAMADPAGAFVCYRAIAAERGIVIGTQTVRTERGDFAAVSKTMVSKLVTTESRPFPSCSACRHGRRPGGLTLLCGGRRDDLPPAYGEHHPLRRLPGNGGADCNLFKEWA